LNVLLSLVTYCITVNDINSHTNCLLLQPVTYIRTWN